MAKAPKTMAINFKGLKKMKNYLIYFRDESLKVTHQIYVRAKNRNNIIEAAKRYLKIEDYYGYDYMDYGQSKKKGIPFISI